MIRFQQVEQFLAHFRQLLAERYRPTAGALFSAVLAREDQMWFLANGRVLFLDTAAEARPSIKYSAIRLVEEWVPNQEAAHQRLALLLSGHGVIEGESIPPMGEFQSTDKQQHPSWRPRPTVWREAVFKTESYKGAGNRPTVTREPVTGFGLPPYESGAQAIHEWLYGDLSRERYASDPSDLGSLFTVLPDTRARLVSAEWRNKQMEVHLEVNIPREQLELQCIFSGSTLRRDVLQRAPSDQFAVDVPEDAQGVSMYLLHSSGEHLGRSSAPRRAKSPAESIL